MAGEVVHIISFFIQLIVAFLGAVGAEFAFTRAIGRTDKHLGRGQGVQQGSDFHSAAASVSYAPTDALPAALQNAPQGWEVKLIPNSGGLWMISGPGGFQADWAIEDGPAPWVTEPVAHGPVAAQSSPVHRVR